jgi:hypothetical protein
MSMTPEQVAYWYVRLNGFLSIPNFVVHPDVSGAQLGEVDVVGMRFPLRAENEVAPMRDADVFTLTVDRPLLAIVEAKRRRISLNATWRAPRFEVLFRVLRAVGLFKRDEAAQAARALAERGGFDNRAVVIRLVGLGEARNGSLSRSHPALVQITWTEVLAFVFERFRVYEDVKRRHDQWDRTGKLLWAAAYAANDSAAFTRAVLADMTEQ